MAQQSRSANQTEIDTLLADNSTGDISALDVRTTITNQNDSNFNKDSDTLTDIAQPTGSKTTPIDADSVALVDSAASNVFKRVTWANVKATLKTYFDTFYATFAQGALADTALQPGDIGSTVQAHDSQLDSIAGLTPGAEGRMITSNGLGGYQISTVANVRTYLNVEDGADVTDATNVNAAGAVMNTDYNQSHSVLVQQNSTGSPEIVHFNNNSILGKSGGDIDALTAAEVRSIINVADGATANPNAIDNVVEDTTPQLGGDLDLNGNGIILSVTAGATVVEGDVVQLQADGKYDPADASAESTAKGMLGVALDAGNDTEIINIMIKGSYTTTALIPGSEYYLSESAGAITDTKPSATSSIVRLIGYALSTEELFVNISPTYLEND
tara:strand:+ start:359 stop:1516 length:1158 start_codon:yes stop_codon:yes gene_type:complete